MLNHLKIGLNLKKKPEIWIMGFMLIVLISLAIYTSNQVKILQENPCLACAKGGGYPPYCIPSNFIWQESQCKEWCDLSKEVCLTQIFKNEK